MLEEMAIGLSAETFLYTPQQYLDNPNPGDPIGRAWNQCVHATMGASIACERLGDLLRAKAGIKEPGPTEEFMADGGQELPAAVSDGGEKALLR